MGGYLRQSTAETVSVGPFLDSADGVTEEIALTISQADIRLRKKAGSFAQTSNVAGAVHDEKGYYAVPLSVTDTNTIGSLRLAVHESGALPVWDDFYVLAANVYDSLFGAATDKLQTDLVQIGDDVQSGTDLKDFVDDGYDPATKKVTGVKTVDVTTDMLSISGSTDAADKLEASAETIVIGAAVAGTLTTTDMTTDLTETTNDHYNGRRLIWTSGLLKDQATAITGYDGTEKQLTYTAVTDSPGIGDTFNIV